MVQDADLRRVALVHFIQERKLLDMLLEGEMQHTLNFEISKDLTLRAYLGAQEFRELALTAVRVLGDTEPTTCVLILDKITETRQVMERLIEMQVK